MKRGSLISLAIALAGVLTSAHGAEAGQSPMETDVLSISAIGGVVVQYPREWRAAVTKDGKVVAMVGPTRGGFRPAATFLVTRGQGDIGKMLDSASSGLGKQAQVTLLGERHLSSDRWTRYYVRGEMAAAEYVVIGVAQGHGWIVTMVGVDVASDPLLRVHAEVLQALLVAVIFPAHRDVASKASP